MSHLGGVRAREMVRVIKKLGFYPVRQKGSHLFFQHNDGRTTLVPIHGGEEISRGLLNEMLDQVKISPEEFRKLRRK